MSRFLVLWRRELAATFLSPIAYIVAIFFLLLTGFNYYFLVELMASERVSVNDVLGQLFESVLFFWPPFLLLVPILTMRVFAEEKRSGTIETLMTAPVTEWMVVLAKYAGVLACFAALWAPTVAYGFILRTLSAEPLPIDPGVMAGGYLGTFLAGMFFLSIGVFASALTRNQIVAAIVCFALSGLVFYAGFLHYSMPETLTAGISTYISAFLHQHEFARGSLDTRPIVFYLSGSAFMLFTTARLLEARSW